MEVLIYVQESIFAMIIQMLCQFFLFQTNELASKLFTRIEGPHGTIKLTLMLLNITQN